MAKGISLGALFLAIAPHLYRITRRTAKEFLFAKYVGQWLDASGKWGA